MWENARTNRRVQYARRALREALIDLVSEKPLANISVHGYLCARADINTSTFYLHYQGVHKLLVKLKTKLLRKSKSTSCAALPANAPARLVNFLKHFKQSPRDIKLPHALSHDQGDPHFVRRLQQLIYDAFQRGWQNRMPEASESHKMLTFSYIVRESFRSIRVDPW